MTLYERKQFVKLAKKFGHYLWKHKSDITEVTEESEDDVKSMLEMYDMMAELARLTTAAEWCSKVKD